MGLTLLYLNAEAILARRWPSRVKLRENMKGEVQERSLRLHLPYSGAGAAAVTSPDSARANARAAGAAIDQAAPVWALKRPLPFESRAALLQDPPRRPKASIMADMQSPRADMLESSLCQDKSQA